MVLLFRRLVRVLQVAVRRLQETEQVRSGVIESLGSLASRPRQIEQRRLTPLEVTPCVSERLSDSAGVVVHRPILPCTHVL